MMKKTNILLIASMALFTFFIGSCNNNPINPNDPIVQNIIDSLGIDTNNSNCTLYYTVAYDSINDTYTFDGQGSGVSPIQYIWVVGQDTLYGQTITVQGPVTDFCVAMLDDAGCFTSVCDSVSVNNGGGNNNGACSVAASAYVDSTGNNMVFASANATGIPPYTYTWTVNGTSYTGQTISWQGASGLTYQACVTSEDANACTSTDCITITVP